MPLRSATPLLILLFTLPIFAQKEYPVGYFRSPVDYTPSLSGTFAEIRSGHFHSGIDYRTQGVEGKPIYAAADGHVSRIRISPGGFGKALYIDHPNGYTTVCAHLRNFKPELQKHITNEQYRLESFDVDLYPVPGKFTVKKGEVIAWSGNSGSSGGPHLHFEIRKTDNQNPMNPKLFGLNIMDDIAPVIQNLKIYPADEFSAVNGKPRILLLGATAVNGSYQVKENKPISIAGKVAFGIQAFDRHNHSELRNGIASIEVFIDSEPVFSYRVDAFDFNDTRYVNAVIDYEELILNNRRFIQTRILPNNPLKIYRTKNRGIFTFSGDQSHEVRIEVGDIAGNKSSLKFSVIAISASETPLVQADTNGKTRFYFSQANNFKTNDFSIELPANALYENIWFSINEQEATAETVAKRFQVHDIYTPVHRNFTISIKTKIEKPELHSKAVVVRTAIGGKSDWVSEGGSYKNGFMTASARTFGIFSVMLDTVAPKIVPVNIAKGKNISQQKNIRVKISDDLSGIKSYRGTMNGKWILMDYDAKNQLLVYEIDSRTVKGNNQFRLVVEDQVGNSKVYEATLIR